MTPTLAAQALPTLRTLIANSRQRLAGAVNAELTRLYWAVGKRLTSNDMHASKGLEFPVVALPSVGQG